MNQYFDVLRNDNLQLINRWPNASITRGPVTDKASFVSHSWADQIVVTVYYTSFPGDQASRCTRSELELLVWLIRNGWIRHHQLTKKCLKHWFFLCQKWLSNMFNGEKNQWFSHPEQLIRLFLVLISWIVFHHKKCNFY